MPQAALPQPLPSPGVRPLQLIGVDPKTGEVHVGEEAAAVLRAIRTPIAGQCLCNGSVSSSWQLASHALCFMHLLCSGEGRGPHAARSSQAASALRASVHP